MPSKSESGSASNSSATIGFEAKLWLVADKLRNNMDAAEYKHVVLDLIFLKYISDTFEEHHAKLAAGRGDYAGANPEDQDECKAENVFWVPKEARWSHLQASAKQPTIGKIVDDAMVSIERDHPRLKGVLPNEYARAGLDKHRLEELIDLIATITLTAASEGEKTDRSVDLIGRVYEYFLARFASAEGKNGGQRDQAAIYGQESNATKRRLAVINLVIRGFNADFGPDHADTFRRGLHPELCADWTNRESEGSSSTTMEAVSTRRTANHWRPPIQSASEPWPPTGRFTRHSFCRIGP